MSSFVDFISDNGILATSAGITIGFATATFIKSFVADVVIPVIVLVVYKFNSNGGKFVGRLVANKELHFANFVSEMITWVLIIVASFFIIDAIRTRLVTRRPGPPTSGVFMPPQRESFSMEEDREQNVSGMPGMPDPDMSSMGMGMEEQQLVEPSMDDKQFAMY